MKAQGFGFVGNCWGGGCFQAGSHKDPPLARLDLRTGPPFSLICYCLLQTGRKTFYCFSASFGLGVYLGLRAQVWEEGSRLVAVTNTSFTFLSSKPIHVVLVSF